MAGNPAFWVDVLDSSGNRVGGGPIITSTRWTSVARLNAAGTFTLVMPASDGMAAQLSPRREVRCYTIIGNTVTLIGSGIVNNKAGTVGSRRATMLTVSGPDMLGELRHRTVGSLSIDDGAGGPDTSGPSDIIALAPSGWALDTTAGYSSTSTSVLHTFGGETCLEAFVRLSELTAEHFRAGSGRKVVWMRSDTPSSGILLTNANPAGGDNPNIGYIERLRSVVDSTDLISRVYPHGQDTGSGRITLSSATWTPPSGYTLDTANNYIRRDATETTYGRFDVDIVWDDIADANTLAKTAYAKLLRDGELYDAYDIDVTGLQTVLYPGQTVRVLYHEWREYHHVSNIDDPSAPGQGAEMTILEVTTTVNENGVAVNKLRVSNVDRWPRNDATITTDIIRRLRMR